MSLFSGLLAFVNTALAPPTEAPEVVILPGGRKYATLVRDGYSLEIADAPRISRPDNLFSDVRSMAWWVGRHAYKPERVHILVNEERGMAAYLPANDSSKAWRATLKMEKHPRYERWEEAFDKNLNQQQIYRLFVTAREDFDRAVDASGEDIGSYGTELASQLRKLNVKRDSKVEVELDANGNYRASGATDQHTLSARLPSEFDIIVPVYEGVEDDKGEEITYSLRVHLDVVVQDQGPPVFVVRCPGQAVVIHQAVRDTAAMLQRELDGRAKGFMVGLGKLNSSVLAGVLPHYPTGRPAPAADLNPHEDDAGWPVPLPGHGGDEGATTEGSEA